MARKMLIFALVFFLAGLCFPTSNVGDGTYKLRINDTILSDNNFTIKAVNISYSTVQDQIVVSNVTYQISSPGATPVNVVLNESGSYGLARDSATKNVTVTASDLGYETAGTIAVIIIPFAYTEVDSSTYVPPGPDVKITSMNIDPSYFSATIDWSTNASANGTARLYDEYGTIRGSVSKISQSQSFSATFSGLTSYSNYSVLVISCTEKWCVNQTKSFSTLPVVPEISNVKVLAYGDTWANIYWETDVKSDESVFYRKQGTTAWSQVPSPSDPWKKISQYVAYEPGIVIPGNNPLEDLWQEIAGQQQYGTAPAKKKASLAAAGSYIPSYSSIQTMVSSHVGINTSVGAYAISSDIIAKAPNKDVIAYLARVEHQINLKDLDDQTAYEFKAQSCADKCANSSIYTFTTNRTNLPPTIEVSSQSPIYLGTSEVLYLHIYANNPGADISSVILSWNDGGVTKTMVPKYSGDLLVFAPASGASGKEAIVSITFSSPGLHDIKVGAVDSIGMNATKDVWISVQKSKTACTATSSIYYPSSTTCTSTWPNDPQGVIEYNTGIGKCHATEVCDASLDYVIADAESCCNGERSFSAYPDQSYGYSYDKGKACDRAIAYTRASGAMTTLDAFSSMKTCKAAYLVYGLGSEAVYMKDYYTGEFCCADSDSLCPGLPHFTAGPWPQSNILFGSLKCYFTKYDPWIGDTTYYPKKGWYTSDTDPAGNNNAAVDIPPHSSINVMNTGTCVDYSFAVTTLLRKAGFEVNEIMTMNAPGHNYNLVWLPGATKFTFIDTVGNNGGDFFTGPGWNWTVKGAYQDHCSYRSNVCSSDYGVFTCPARSDIEGC